jgi:23S rRNA G2445 N2-methylase RlmL
MDEASHAKAASPDARVGRTVLKGVNRIVVTAPPRIVPFLAQEIRALGYPVVAEAAMSVETEGAIEDAMRMNLWLRTAHRVHWPLAEFHAGGPQDLYDGVYRFPWESLLDPGGYVSVHSAVDHPSIRDTRFANQRTKDAIVDRMLARCGRRPDSGPDKHEAAVVYVHWKDEWCTVHLDTSGESLSKRGYRRIPFLAPMQETLAAATVLATGWRGEGAFLNPMCGSGTVAIEAALVALGRAPGLTREGFGFQYVYGYRRAAWERMLAEARAAVREGFPGRIVATDIAAEAIGAAQRNAASAGVERWIELERCSYEETPVPEGGGVVLVNPQYGERMGEDTELEPLYKGIGDFFKQRCAGYRGYVLTGNPELAKRIGLRPKRRIPFYNASIDCRLLEYELYEGSRSEGAAARI